MKLKYYICLKYNYLRKMNYNVTNIILYAVSKYWIEIKMSQDLHLWYSQPHNIYNWMPKAAVWICKNLLSARKDNSHEEV